MLFSASEYNGRVRFSDSAYYFKKQLFATALGLMAMYFVSQMDYHILAKMAPASYFLSIVLSTAVLLVGQEINGSKRWLNLGPLSFQPSEFAKVLNLGPLSFQPSEFAKVAVILFLGWQIEKSRKSTGNILFMCRTMATLLPIVGLVGSNNLSTAVIILGIGVVLIFVSNPRYLPFVGIGAAGFGFVAVFLAAESYRLERLAIWILGIGVVLIFVSNPRYLPFVGIGAAGFGFVAVFLAAESYRLERLAIWRNPEKYEKGFQTIQGLYAIGSGGLFGRGLGSSIQKLGFVPEAQNDMIFSVICEELGLFGASLLILVFMLLLWRLCVISTHSRDLLGALLTAGIMARAWKQHSEAWICSGGAE